MSRTNVPITSGGGAEARNRLLVIVPFTMSTSSSRTPKSAGRPVACQKTLDNVEFGRYDRHDHQLRKTFQRPQCVCDCSSIPATHHQRALVVGIDQADQVT